MVTLSSLQVLSCLVQIASVRRSLFNNAERAKFLSHLVDGVKRILENPQVRVRDGEKPVRTVQQLLPPAVIRSGSFASSKAWKMGKRL